MLTRLLAAPIPHTITITSRSGPCLWNGVAECFDAVWFYSLGHDMTVLTFNDL